MFGVTNREPVRAPPVEKLPPAEVPDGQHHESVAPLELGVIAEVPNAHCALHELPALPTPVRQFCVVVTDAVVEVAAPLARHISVYIVSPADTAGAEAPE